MEQHPVPQNVTTFQFRLIGDMTIKQFGYLAGGAILAYLSYKLPLPFFFTWPLATFFALVGFGFAFVPVEERPMDVWVFSFFKSIYSPTQYIWHQTPARVVSAKGEPVRRLDQPSPTARQGGQPTPHPDQPTAVQRTPSIGAIERIFTPLVPEVPDHATAASRPPRRGLFETIAQWFSLKHPKLYAPTSPSAPPIPPVVGWRRGSASPLGKTGLPSQKAPTPIQTKTPASELEQKLADLQKELATKTITEARVVELQKQLNELVSHRATMETELADLHKKLAQAAQPPPARRPPPFPAAPYPFPPPGKRPPATLFTDQTTVKTISGAGAVRAGLPRLTTFPNVVTGIIKDHQGGLLPGVLVTIRDKDDVPLRALKTNKLGQFAASTPLPSGTYVVEIEDPRGRFVFDRAQITLAGSVAPALEIIAKSQKEITRQQLAQEIFGKPNI